MDTQIAEDPVPKVVIYTSSDCHWCEKAKTYLIQRGVPFSVKDVEVDEAAGREAISLSGQRGTPVITVGSKVIVGFRRRDLDAALGLDRVDATTEAIMPAAQDTLAEAAAARKVQWTPEQQATAATLARMLDVTPLCYYVAGQFEYSLARCDHTFRYVSAFLAEHPPADSDADSVLATLRSLDVQCDCDFVANVCIR